jgi:hypothetical protein
MGVPVKTVKRALTDGEISKWWLSGVEILAAVHPATLVHIHEQDIDANVHSGEGFETIEGMRFFTLLNRSDLLDELRRLGDGDLRDTLPHDLCEALASAINTAGPGLHEDDIRQAIADWNAER